MFSAEYQLELCFGVKCVLGHLLQHCMFKNAQGSVMTKATRNMGAEGAAVNPVGRAPACSQLKIKNE